MNGNLKIQLDSEEIGHLARTLVQKRSPFVVVVSGKDKAALEELLIKGSLRDGLEDARRWLSEELLLELRK